MIKKSLPCPIVGCYHAANIILSRESFERACVAHQKLNGLWSDIKPRDVLDCKHCEIGRKILAAERYEPLAGIRMLGLGIVVSSKGDDGFDGDFKVTVSGKGTFTYGGSDDLTITSIAIDGTVDLYGA